MRLFMIFDGRWKSELKRLSWEISFWHKLPAFCAYAEHRLNRAVLYSATILRKIIEDETEAETIAKEAKISPPKLITVHSALEAIKLDGLYVVSFVLRITEKAKTFL